MSLKAYFNELFNTDEHRRRCSIINEITTSYPDALKIFEELYSVPRGYYERMEYLCNHFNNIKNIQQKIDTFVSIKRNYSWAYNYYLRETNSYELDKNPTYPFMALTCDNEELIKKLSVMHSKSQTCKALAPKAYNWFLKHFNLIEDTVSALQAIEDKYDEILNSEKAYNDYDTLIGEYPNGFYWYLQKYGKDKVDDLLFILETLSDSEEIILYENTQMLFNKYIEFYYLGICLFLGKRSGYDIDDMGKVCSSFTDVSLLQKRLESVQKYWDIYNRGCVELLKQKHVSNIENNDLRKSAICDIKVIEILEQGIDKIILYQKIIDAFDVLIQLECTKIFLDGAKYSLTNKKRVFDHKDDILACEKKLVQVQELKKEYRNSFDYYYPNYDEEKLFSNGFEDAFSMLCKIITDEKKIKDNNNLIGKYQYICAHYKNGLKLVLGDNYKVSCLEDCATVIAKERQIKQAQRNWNEINELKKMYPSVLAEITKDVKSIQNIIKHKSSLENAEKVLVAAKNLSDSQLAAFDITRESLCVIDDPILDEKRAGILVYLEECPGKIQVPKQIDYGELSLKNIQAKMFNKLLHDNEALSSALSNDQFVENWDNLCKIGCVLEKLNNVFIDERVDNPPVITGNVLWNNILDDEIRDLIQRDGLSYLFDNLEQLFPILRNKVLAYPEELLKIERDKLIADANAIKNQYAKGYNYLANNNILPSSVQNVEDAHQVLSHKNEIISEFNRITEEERIIDKVQQLKRYYGNGYDYYERNGDFPKHASTLDEYRKIVQYEYEIKNKHKEIEEAERKKQELIRFRSALSSWPDEIIGLPYYYIHIYYPYRINGVVFDVSPIEREHQKYVWNFKDGVTDVTNDVATKIGQELKDRLGNDISRTVLFCIPASTQQKNEIRYKKFCSLVSEKYGIQNAYSYIQITSGTIARHMGGTGDVDVTLDANFFRDKCVVLFDDVVTTGRSIDKYKSKLEAIGAHIIGAMSVGRTRHSRV